MSAIDGGTVDEKVAYVRKLAETDAAQAQEVAWGQIVALQTLAKSHREQADERLNELFRRGQPVRGLDGPTDGILVMTTTNAATDVAVKALTSVVMPWKGKRFDAETGTGDNRMTEWSAPLSKLLWPLYSMKEAKGEDKVAFDFQTYVEPGKDDPDLQVMVIDYSGVKSNPRLVIRSIRDELVEIVPGTYLGKILFQLPTGSYSKIGYFALRTDNHNQMEGSR